MNIARLARLWPRSLRCAAAGLLFVALALGCRPPGACPPMHEPHQETLCPPCENIENAPPGHCRCSVTTVCRPSAAMREWTERQQRDAALRGAEAQRRALEARRAQLALEAGQTQQYAIVQADVPRPYFPRVTGMAECASPCPDGGRREVELLCSERGVRRSEIVARCDGLEDVSELGCAEPWRVLAPRCMAVVPIETPPQGRCDAGPGRCCLDDGRVVTPCGPGPTPLPSQRDCVPMRCGSGGFCRPCR